MRATVAVLSFLLLIAAAFAQFDLDMAQMSARPSIALMRDDIRKELKLRKDQNSAISQIQKEMNLAMRGSGNDLAAAMGSLDKMKEADAKIVAILDEPQKKRFSEIQIQIQGMPAAANPEIAEPLKLTEDQVGQIKSFQADYQKETMALMMNRPDKSTMGKIEKLAADRDKKILDLMSAEQQAKFKEMQGATLKNARPKGIF